MVEFRAVERRTRPIDLAHGENLVIRVWSWDEARLLKDAEGGYEIETVLKGGVPPAYYSISVFALPFKDSHASVEGLIDELRLHAAKHRRFKWYCLVSETELNSAGFELILNEPPDDHYDIPLGEREIDLGKVHDLAVLLGDEKIRMRT